MRKGIIVFLPSMDHMGLWPLGIWILRNLFAYTWFLREGMDQLGFWPLGFWTLRNIYAYARILRSQRSPATQRLVYSSPSINTQIYHQKFSHHFVLLSQFQSLSKMWNTESSEEEPEFLRNDEHEQWSDNDNDDLDFDPSNFAVSKKL